jgi:ABC-type dipeptide/oligopeptide/nickel transport system permease component
MNNRYLLNRLISAALALWLAFTLVFAALRAIPGDAVTATLLRSGASSTQITERRTELGLDQPAPVQYIQAILAIFKGDLGTSLVSNRPVQQIVSEQLGASLALASGALLIATILGVALGIIAALSTSAWQRRTATLSMSLLLSSPIYWTGTFLIYLFSVALKLLPSAGGNDFRSLILPSLALGLSVAGGISRVTAGSLRELQHAEFVRTAQAKGLPTALITSRHILRAGLAPILAVIGLQAGFMIGGAVVTETLFVRQGLGQVLISAIHDRDFPVVQAIVLLSAVAYSTINLVTDYLIALVDPRVYAP